MSAYDVVIAGAGSVGLPLSYYCAKRGLKVLVLDREASWGRGQNRAAIGGIRATHSAPAKIKLGYLVKQPEEPWFQYEWKGADAAAAKYGFELIKIAVPDGEKTLAAIDSLAANGAQGFVICTPDVRLGPAIVAKARAAGLKVVTVDDRFLGADGNFLTEVPYLGLSATKIGRMSGVTLAAEMQRRGWAAAVPGGKFSPFMP